MGPSRGLRGGSWGGVSNYLDASIRAVDAPTYEISSLGFRVASSLLPGDANEDGTVNGDDLNIVLSYYDQTGMTWSQGDFDGDGTVNGADLNTVLSYYDQSFGICAASIAVPEPGSMALVVWGVVAALFWKRLTTDRPKRLDSPPW